MWRSGTGLKTLSRCSCMRMGVTVARDQYQNCVTITDFVAAKYSSLARCCGGVASQIKGDPSGQNVLPAKSKRVRRFVEEGRRLGKEQISTVAQLVFSQNTLLYDSQ